MKNVKLISREEIKSVLSMKTTMELVESVYLEHGKNQVLMPSKVTLDTGEGNDWPPYGGSYNAMPAYIGGETDSSGIKWVWGFEDNYKQNIPYIGGVIILNERKTGEILAIMDGSYITDIRTGASAGVAAKYLAKNNSKILTIIGAGVQGRTNAQAIAEALEIEEIRVYDVREDVATRYAKEVSDELDVAVRVCDTLETACRDSDIIVTVTIADEPLVMYEWLKKGATVLSLGSFQELDENIPLNCSKLVVDSWEQNAHRGELLKLVDAGKITEKNIHAEMQDIVIGKKPARENDEEIICACIIGMGSTDIGIAANLYKRNFENNNSLAKFDFR